MTSSSDFSLIEIVAENRTAGLGVAAAGENRRRARRRVTTRARLLLFARLSAAAAGACSATTTAASGCAGVARQKSRAPRAAEPDARRSKARCLVRWRRLACRPRTGLAAGSSTRAALRPSPEGLPHGGHGARGRTHTWRQRGARGRRLHRRHRRGRRRLHRRHRRGRRRLHRRHRRGGGALRSIRAPPAF